MSNRSANQLQLPPEQEVIRAKCFHPTGNFVEFPKEEIEQSIPERFEKIVAKYPDRIAVKTRNQQISYAELNYAANWVAQTVLAADGDGHQPIALLLENNASMIAAMMGVLKVGKIYVPMDPYSRQHHFHLRLDGTTQGRHAYAS